MASHILRKATIVAFSTEPAKIVVYQSDVMKYNPSLPVVRSKEVLHANLLKMWAPSQVFFNEFDHTFRTVILKETSQWLFLRTIIF